MKAHRCARCGTYWACEAQTHGRKCDLPTTVVCNECRGSTEVR